MYEIVYLSTEDRKSLEETQMKIARASSDEERSRLYETIREIEARKKNLRDLNRDECIALKAQLYDKFQKLLKIGRATQARQFNVMLQTVDFRIRLLDLEAKKNPTPSQIVLHVVHDKPAASRKTPKSERASERNASGKSIWSRIKIDDD